MKLIVNHILTPFSFIKPPRRYGSVKTMYFEFLIDNYSAAFTSGMSGFPKVARVPLSGVEVFVFYS